jgi:hypothetical protein
LREDKQLEGRRVSAYLIWNESTLTFVDRGPLRLARSAIDVSKRRVVQVVINAQYIPTSKHRTGR